MTLLVAVVIGEGVGDGFDFGLVGLVELGSRFPETFPVAFTLANVRIIERKDENMLRSIRAYKLLQPQFILPFTQLTCPPWKVLNNLLLSLLILEILKVKGEKI